MVTIVRLSTKPCFLCGSHQNTVEVRFKDRTFAGIVCKDHLFQLLQKRTDGLETAEGQESADEASQ